MKRTLKSIAMQLTESDIQELIRLKKQGGKKAETLRKKRDKLAAELARVDAELKKLTGEEPEAAVRKPRGRRPGPAKAKAAAKKPAAKGKKRGKRMNILAAVREVFTRAGEPLRARQVVEQLPAAGVKVTDVQDMRKRVSVVLAQAKNSFEQVERGVYRLKD